MITELKKTLFGANGAVNGNNIEVEASSNLKYNPDSETLTAAFFSGDITSTGIVHLVM